MTEDVQWICVLGATGSIGESALDVISRDDSYRVFALTANTNVAGLLDLCLRYEPLYAAMADETAAAELAGALHEKGCPTEVRSGTEALEAVAADERVGTVVAGIVGAAGLIPTLAAVEAGKKILLANKEALVMAGDLFMSKAACSGAVVLPVDSEHNAIFQCLPHDARLPGGSTATSVRKVMLTASGGPFLDRAADELVTVTPDQACRHPNWSMGPKISVDSATMMNKGLELIEACYLFSLPADAVEVLIHPQSIVHSLVEYVDGSVIAQMGTPDMRIPIAHALAWPRRMESGAAYLDLVKGPDLHFRAPDLSQFPCLALGMRAARSGGRAAICLNAANEVAVEAFLRGRIGFTDIPVIIERTLSMVADAADVTGAPEVMTDVDMILRVDAHARAFADEQLDVEGRS